MKELLNLQALAEGREWNGFCLYDMNLQDRCKQTLLHVASTRVLARHFIQAGADVDALDEVSQRDP